MKTVSHRTIPIIPSLFVLITLLIPTHLCESTEIELKRASITPELKNVQKLDLPKSINTLEIPVMSSAIGKVDSYLFAHDSSNDRLLIFQWNGETLELLEEYSEDISSSNSVIHNQYLFDFNWGHIFEIILPSTIENFNTY